MVDMVVGCVCVVEVFAGFEIYGALNPNETLRTRIMQA